MIMDQVVLEDFEMYAAHLDALARIRSQHPTVVVVASITPAGPLPRRQCWESAIYMAALLPLWLHRPSYELPNDKSR